jgi:Holliday junction DNA helicase RuvA
VISLVTGIVRAVSTDKAIIEVGGVGLSLAITSQTSSQLHLGSNAQLFTSLVVREDSLTLFGFLDEQSRITFELLQTVSGVGPKVALAVMGSHSSESLSKAIAQEDIKAIEKVPGIGRKGAQRMILELKGKLTDFGSASTPQTHQPIWREQLMSALISLGYSSKESDGAINDALAQYSEQGVDPATLELSELLKRVLQAGRRS